MHLFLPLFLLLQPTSGANANDGADANLPGVFKQLSPSKNSKFEVGKTNWAAILIKGEPKPTLMIIVTITPTYPFSTSKDGFVTQRIDQHRWILTNSLVADILRNRLPPEMVKADETTCPKPFVVQNIKFITQFVAVQPLTATMSADAKLEKSDSEGKESRWIGNSGIEGPEFGFWMRSLSPSDSLWINLIHRTI